MQCKTAMFDSSIPTSPQKLNAQSASHLVCVCLCCVSVILSFFLSHIIMFSTVQAKEFFGAQNEAYKKNPESRDEKAYEKFRWQVLNSQAHTHTHTQTHTHKHTHTHNVIVDLASGFCSPSAILRSITTLYNCLL